MADENGVRDRKGRPAVPTGFALPHLRAWLEYKGVTQAKIAEAVGRSEPSVSRWLNGQVNVNAQQLQIIATTLDIPLSSLFRSPQHEASVDVALELWDLMLRMRRKDRDAILTLMQTVAQYEVSRPLVWAIHEDKHFLGSRPAP